MAVHQISVDAGQGFTAAMLAQKNGKHKNFAMPSVRVPVTGDTLHLGDSMEMAYEWVDYQGQRYAVGDTVLQLSRSRLARHLGTNRYGNTFHAFLVDVAVANLIRGGKSSEVDLVLFAPPGVLNDVRQRMVDRFEGRQAAVRLKGDKTERTWTYRTVKVLPEGIGLPLCLILDERGNRIGTDALAGLVTVLDLGAGSADVVRMVDGKMRVEDLTHMTWMRAGINEHIRQPILRDLKNNGPEYRYLTVDDIDYVIRQGIMSDDWTLTVVGQEIDLFAAVTVYSEQYATWLADEIIDTTLDSFREGEKWAALCGGGATLTESHLREWYGDVMLDYKSHPGLRGVHPVDVNVSGGLRYLLQQAQKVARR